jgi:subtilisin family serine protease
MRFVRRPTTRRYQLANHVKGAPLDPPRWAEEPRLRDRSTLRDGRGTTVAVVDSGLSRHPWLVPDNEPLPLADTDMFDLSGEALPRHIGHGTFVAGIVRQYAPQSNLVSRRVVDMTGHADDGDLAAALTGLIELDPDVVNLSLVPGGDDPGTTDEGTCRTLAAVRRLQEDCGTVIVTAAGNDGDDFPTERLAPDDELTVVVGALDLGGRPAWFSNTQHVNIWAPGVDVLSTFIRWHGPLSSVQHDDDHGADDDDHDHAAIGAATETDPVPVWPVAPFAGWARWNGTSFAAPAVAGAIAAEISRLHHLGDRKERRLAALRQVLATAGTIDADDKRKVLSAKPIVLAGPPTA